MKRSVLVMCIGVLVVACWSVAPATALPQSQAAQKQNARPNCVVIFTVDQADLLFGKSEAGARNDYFYFCKGELHAVRNGKWKLILPNRKKFYGYVKDKGSQHTELYDLESDIGESKDVAKAHPELVKQLRAKARALPLPHVPYDERIGLGKRALKKAQKR